MTERAIVTGVTIHGTTEQYHLRYQGTDHWMLRGQDSQLVRSYSANDRQGGSLRPQVREDLPPHIQAHQRKSLQTFRALERAVTQMHRRLPTAARYAARQLVRNKKTQRQEEIYPSCVSYCSFRTLVPIANPEQRSDAYDCEKNPEHNHSCDIITYNGVKTCTEVATKITLAHDNLKGAQYGAATFVGFTPNTHSGRFTFQYRGADIIIARGDIDDKFRTNTHGRCVETHTTQADGMGNQFIDRLLASVMQTLNPRTPH